MGLEYLPPTYDLEAPSLEKVFQGYGVLKLTWFDLVVDETDSVLSVKVYRKGDTGGEVLYSFKVSPLGHQIDDLYSEEYGCYLPTPRVSITQAGVHPVAKKALLRLGIFQVRDLITNYTRAKLLLLPDMGKRKVWEVEQMLLVNNWLPKTWMHGYSKIAHKQNYKMPPPCLGSMTYLTKLVNPL